jgi:hypothetical protein
MALLASYHLVMSRFRDVSQERRSVLLGMLGMWVSLFAPDQGIAGRYTFKDLPPSATEPFSINDNNEIVGINGAGGFIIVNGNFSQLPNGSSEFQARGVSDSGVIAGDIGSNAVIYANGIFQEIDVSFPNLFYAAADSVNDYNQVVGWYDLKQGPNGNEFHGFVYSNGKLTTLDYNNDAVLQGINDSGEIIGEYKSNDYSHAYGFIDNNGQFTTLSVPGALNTQVWGLSNSSTIVGDYTYYNGGPTYGFIYKNGIFHTIVEPKSTGLTVIQGINDQGTIVGYYGSASGAYSSAFVGTFIPEPRIWSLMLLGAFAAGATLRQRRVPHLNS